MKKLMLFGIIAILTASVLTPSTRAQSTTLWVDDDGAQCPQTTYTDIPAALADANDGDTIRVCAGSYTGDYVYKRISIVGHGQGVEINAGPAHSSGLIMGFRFMEGSDYSKISFLTFNVDLAIMNGTGVDGVWVSHNTFNNSVQAVSNWAGNYWLMEYNQVKDLQTRNGGGIGFLIGTFNGEEAKFNKVRHNKIMGTLHVWSQDGGGYDGTGVVLYADYRWGRTGGEISHNAINKNVITISSDTPNVVDIVGIELTDTRDDETIRDVVDNLVTQNHLRHMTRKIELTPTNLGDYNSIYNNFE